MRKMRLFKFFLCVIFTACLCAGMPLRVMAETVEVANVNAISQLQLVTQQIGLLKNRLAQAQAQLARNQEVQDKDRSEVNVDQLSKEYLDKAALDITVLTSNYEGIGIELADALQSVSGLEKTVQEIKNQLNAYGIFGAKAADNGVDDATHLAADLKVQEQLLTLQKKRANYLTELSSTVRSTLQIKKNNLSRLVNLSKSQKMLKIKQQQVQDELAYQAQQNYWLQQLTDLNAKLAKLDPAKQKADYIAIERDIFYANENANFSYIQALMARYKDQIQQIKLAMIKNNSISVLNDIGEQNQSLMRQINQLNTVLLSRIAGLNEQINYIKGLNLEGDDTVGYLKSLTKLKADYISANTLLTTLSNNLSSFRGILDQAMKSELSSRQGLPEFDSKVLLDLGKEVLLVPALTLQMGMGLANQFIHAFTSMTVWMWIVLAVIETLLLFSFSFTKRLLERLVSNTDRRDTINTGWFMLLWLQRSFSDLFIMGNVLLITYILQIPVQNFIFILYLFLVWIIAKSIMIISRLCLVETTHDVAGEDTRLYHRLKWVISIGAVITALTLFAHQLPMIYGIKALCERLFLLWLLVVSFFLLRSYHVVPNLILSTMESQHPYLQRSIRLVGILVPILMFANSIVGLFGYVNLVMTVSWYEGIFLIVLIGYLILRGLLSDAMEQLSRLMIQYVNNGWLWTEAFLKPIDKILRITLFIVAWAVLFLLYGWDKQSPIVERLTGMLHYQLANALGTTITPLNILELCVVISFFYWTAKWTREFVYRLLLSRTKDLGVRNSIAILSQYTVIVVGIFICLRVLGIDLRALTVVAGAFAFGVGLGLRDLANNFACGFLILLERPVRVNDIVNFNGVEGEVINVGSRAVTVRTWDHIELVVPNTEIFNKTFMNLTGKDYIVRCVSPIKINRYDNPHQIKMLIHEAVSANKDVLQDPSPDVLLREISDSFMNFEVRYYVNIRQVESRSALLSSILMAVWDTFEANGIKAPFPHHEVMLLNESELFPAGRK